MRFLKLLGKVLLGLILLVVLLYLVAVLINWKDQPPSADAIRLQGVLAARAPVAPVDNGYVYLLGMGAMDAADIQKSGEARFRWRQAMNADFSQVDKDPLPVRLTFSGKSAPAVKRVLDACSANDPADCAAAFDAVPPPVEWSSTDRILLDRYPGLLARRAWLEVVPNDIRAPIPEYGDVTSGQRLFLLSLRGSDPATVKRALSADLAHWRLCLEHADTLIAKMLAVAGIRQHFQLGNLLLRRLPADSAAAAIPDEWRAPMTRAELSMERPAAGEYEFTRSALRVFSDSSIPDDGLESADEGYRTARKVSILLMRPFYQEQDVVNQMATTYLDAVKAFDVPIEKYPAAKEQLSQLPPHHPFGSRIYDATGDLMRELGGAEIGSYAMRTGNTEAWRRAALLIAELRSAGTPAESVPAALSKSTSVNPLTGAPFGWSAERGGIDVPPVGRGDRRTQYYAW